MKAWLIAVFLFLVMLGIGWAYYNSTQDKIALLIENSVQLEENFKRANEANETNVKTIEQLQLLDQQNQEKFSELQDSFQLIRSQRDELLSRLDRDFDAIALDKPKLLEKLLNNGSANAGRCLELLSGSPKNTKELNAKTAREFNSECPWLFE